MKKITNLLYVLAVLMLVSCNDFLDKSPKYAVDPETTVTDDVAVALTLSLIHISEPTRP